MKAWGELRMQAFGSPADQVIPREPSEHLETCPPLIAGSCARERREPRQIRKEATVPVNSLCRRGAWLSFDGHGEHLL
jgi:hypothetical protein